MMKKIASLFVLVVLALSMIVSPVLAAEDQTSTVLKGTLAQEREARYTEFSELSVAWDNALESGNKGEMRSTYDRLLVLQSQVEAVIALLETDNPVDGFGDEININSINYYMPQFKQLLFQINIKLTEAREVLNIDEPRDYNPPFDWDDFSPNELSFDEIKQKYTDLKEEFQNIETRVNEIESNFDGNCNGNEAALIAELNDFALTAKGLSKDADNFAVKLYALGNRDAGNAFRDLSNDFSNLKQSIEPVIMKVKNCETDLDSYADDLSYLQSKADDYSSAYSPLSEKLELARCNDDTAKIAKIKEELTYLRGIALDLNDDAEDFADELVD